MTTEALTTHTVKRFRRASQIIAQPGLYKVCDQCRSINTQPAHKCHVCGAYRWNNDPVLVADTAREMGYNPFPVTAGVVPRL
jgi:hypothetical protein